MLRALGFQKNLVSLSFMIESAFVVGVGAISGLGLGLALARGFTEGMGGTIEVDDTPGGGLTMVVRLPIAGHVGVEAR